MRFSKDACQYRRQIFGRNSEALKPALKAEDGKAALDEARMTFSSLENSMSLMRRLFPVWLKISEQPAKRLSLLHTREAKQATMISS